ncbi:hypothetical protein EOPP23_04635 [Endozoicomonas sp. OPT23]|uniref:hypothetical protein n=1 Tax=Endozoicomonas sp. OPT23 TaxID=2072845 RepID=UPI00129B7701|nr:hypothetical protein [Endozoicomonas sp. OPT23]MRI32280.1 hypothetical protein [Endozoicomonas sp. OPT23]
MKKCLPLSLLTAAVLATAACSPLPPAVHVSQDNQIKLQSAQHWGAIAQHVSGRITAKLPNAKQAVYIDESQFNTKFSQVFSKQLISQLVNGGVPVLVSPRVDSLELQVQVDTVRHPRDRDNSYFPVSGVLGGIWAVIKAPVVALPVVVAYDEHKSKPSQTDTEVSVTTRLMDGAEIKFSETNVYYITDLSINQFDKSGLIKLTNNEAGAGE